LPLQQPAGRGKIATRSRGFPSPQQWFSWCAIR
jgi:hypothetical protein